MRNLMMPGLALALGMLLGGSLLPAQVHVGVDGDDESGDGSMQAPFATLARALSAPGNEVILEAGEFILSGRVVIPPNHTVRGGYKPVTEPDGTHRWLLSHEPTMLLIPGEAGIPGIVVSDGALLETMTLVGGYVSAELLPGATVRETVFQGGSFAAVHVTEGQPGRETLLERSRILGGGTGIRVEMDGKLTVRETLVRDVFGRGISISGTGDVIVERSVVQRNASDGISVTGNSNVVIENTVVRRNTGHGIRISQASPLVRGVLLERNEHGLLVSGPATPRLQHLTSVANRLSGVYVREAVPEITRSILALNQLYGVEEAGIPGAGEEELPPNGGLLQDVLFWQNDVAAYFDEGEYQLHTVEQIEEELHNSEPPERLLIADPLFANAQTGNYRLSAGSPALDLVERLDDHDFDLDGNNRLVDIPDEGNEGLMAVDLGAYEFQGRLIHHFATTYWDNEGVQDPHNEGSFVVMKKSPLWSFNPASPFAQIEALFLPGRIRYFSRQEESFGAIYRQARDVVQEADKIGVLRTRLSSLSVDGMGDTRLRHAGPEMGEVVTSLVITGGKALAPSPEGITHEVIFDARQGGYRDISEEEKPIYQGELFIDLLDFGNRLVRAPQDLERLEVEWIDRELYDGQFTELVASWDFDPTEPMEWESGGIPGVFAIPTMRYSPSRRALEHVQNQPESFGTWAAPPVSIAPGKLYRFDLKVSSDEPLDRVTSFRVRISSPDFEFTQEVTILSLFSGPTASTEEPGLHRVYGRVPAELAELYGDEGVNLYFFFDLWGLGVGNRGGSILLEELSVYTAPDEL